MAKRDGFHWSPAGYRAANNSPEIVAMIQKRVDAAAAVANASLPEGGDPYVAEVKTGGRVASGKVRTPRNSPGTTVTRLHERRTNTLLKSIQ